MTGTVAMVNKARGFAIVRAEGIEYFALVYKFRDQLDFDLLRPDDRVEFEPYTDPSGRGNGLRAKDVRRAGALP